MNFFETHKGNCLPIIVTILIQASATSIMFLGGPPPWELFIVLLIFYVVTFYTFTIMYNQINEEDGDGSKSNRVRNKDFKSSNLSKATNSHRSNVIQCSNIFNNQCQSSLKPSTLSSTITRSISTSKNSTAHNSKLQIDSSNERSTRKESRLSSCRDSKDNNKINSIFFNRARKRSGSFNDLPIARSSNVFLKIEKFEPNLPTAVSDQINYVSNPDCKSEDNYLVSAQPSADSTHVMTIPRSSGQTEKSSGQTPFKNHKKSFRRPTPFIIASTLKRKISMSVGRKTRVEAANAKFNFADD